MPGVSDVLGLLKSSSSPSMTSRARMALGTAHLPTVLARVADAFDEVAAGGGDFEDFMAGPNLGHTCIRNPTPA